MYTTYNFFPYYWTIDPKETEITAIRVYGIDEINQNICIRINNFTPFIYLELPENIQWTESKAQIFVTKIDNMMGDNRPISKNLIFKEKLFYYHLDDNGKKKKFPYLLLSFSNRNDIKILSYKIRRPIVLSGIGNNIRVKIHEQDADPILQFTCLRDLPTAGWITFKGVELFDDDKITSCNKEYIVKWKDTKRDLKTIVVPRPLIMSFDLEVNSTVVSAMPKATRPGDKTFQISCIIARDGEQEELYRKYLLTLGTPNQNEVGINVIIRCYETESDLLLGYVDLIQEENPNIIIGYNIFGFDIPYMIARAKLNLVFDTFDRQGFCKYAHAKERTIKWSSSAFKNQEFEFLDAEGRLFVDLIAIIRRDYKLDNYKLDTVSNYILGASKDPLTAKGIFKCYRMGMKGGINGNRALGICGKYCITDSVLVIRLFDKLQTWIGLTEMATTYNVPIFLIYTAGQQIKVFSQVYKKCMYDNIVVEKDGYLSKEDEHFQGATVFDPIPGIYDRVCPLDFSSLYPSIIIAYNLDYSTLVKNVDIPDSKCNVIEFEEHIGCKCGKDLSIRKTKPKYILCGSKKYRFIKEPKGVMPSILENLLNARANTRLEMDRLKKSLPNILDSLEKKNIQILISVLDKRQLAYKISANSMYGSMGVSKGYLPFMPGAICTTAIGRKSIELVAKTIPERYGGKLIYGDTDSNYVTFPGLTTASECWERAEFVAEEISKLFPSPMKLSFEEVIYWRFFIVSKKRYMSLTCNKDGVIKNKIEKKGVLLARRDNSFFVKKLYENMIMNIFNKTDNDMILYELITQINKLCSGSFNYKDFVVTKSVGDIGNMIPISFCNEKNIIKAKIGDYIVPLLETQTDKRNKQFKLKLCNYKNDKDNEKEYYLKCLPAQVQLAQKMRKRGQRVDVGSRIEYVITEGPGIKAKQYEKIESADYFLDHKDILKIDYMYYLNNLTNPVDQVLNIIMEEKNIISNTYKCRLIHLKMLTQLKNLFSLKINFEN